MTTSMHNSIYQVWKTTTMELNKRQENDHKCKCNHQHEYLEVVHKMVHSFSNPSTSSVT